MEKLQERKLMMKNAVVLFCFLTSQLYFEELIGSWQASMPGGYQHKL